VEAAYGASNSGLQAIKTKYDAGSLFRVDQNIAQERAGYGAGFQPMSVFEGVPITFRPRTGLKTAGRNSALRKVGQALSPVNPVTGTSAG
jgi:hypothetical protein